MQNQMSQTVSTGMNNDAAASYGAEGGPNSTGYGKKRPVNFSITQSQFNAM